MTEISENSTKSSKLKHIKRWAWFIGLYGLSIGAVALFSYGMRWLLS